MKAGTQAHYRCEICHFRYQFRRLWWAHLLGHEATTAVLFAALLLSSSWLLGYIPVIEALAGMPAGRNIWIHFADGLLLLGLVGCVLIGVGMCLSPGSIMPYCNGCMFCDSCPFYVVTGGEECAGLLIVVAVSLAVAGLLFISKALYGMMYRFVREKLKWAEHMVENVGEASSGGGSGGVGSAVFGTRRRRDSGEGASASNAAAGAVGGASGSSTAVVTRAPQSADMV